MALDKLVDSTQLDSGLTDVANAIRAKSGGSSPLAFPAGFVSEINAIQTGISGVDVVFGHGTATSDHKLTLPIPNGYYFYIFMTNYADSTVSGEVLRLSTDSFGWLCDKKNAVNVNRANGNLTGMTRNTNSLTYSANNSNTVGVLVGGVDYTYIGWKEEPV